MVPGVNGPRFGPRPDTAGGKRSVVSSLVRGSATYTVGNVIARLGSFLLLPVYVRLLTRDEFGIVALVTSLVGLLRIVYTLGMDGALMRLHFDVSDEDRPRLYATLAAFAVGVAGLISVLLGVGLGPFFETVFFGLPFQPYGVLALAIAFVGALDFVPAVMYRAREQPMRFLLFSVGSFVAAAALSVLFVVLGWGAVGVLLGQLIGGAAVMLFSAVVGIWPSRFRFDVSVLGPALKFGAPLLPHQLGAWFLRLSDRWLIGLLLAIPLVDRLGAIGAYSLGYQLGYIVAIVGLSFNAAWTPVFYRVGNGPHGPPFLRDMVTVTAGGFVVLAAALAIMAPEIVEVLARPGYEVAAVVLPIVAFASAFQGIYTMFVSVIFLRRRTLILPLITAASAAANIGLNLLLIPIFGVVGAAWSTLAAYVLFAALTYAAASRIYPIRPDWGRLAGIFFVGVGGSALGYALSVRSTLGSTIADLAAFAVTATICLLLVRAPVARLRHLGPLLDAARGSGLEPVPATS